MFSFSNSILALALASLTMSVVEASPSLRAALNITLTSGPRKLEVDPYYGFVVSHIREDKDWCLTAAYGASEFAKLGFRKCNYEGLPQSQLFKFDADGKLHSALDDSKCMVMNHGNALFNGVRMRLADCGMSTLLNEYSLDGPEGYLKLKLPFDLSPEYCITNRGPNPHNGDTIHAMSGCKNRGDYKWTFKTVVCNELIDNGGFEDGFTSWSVDDSGECFTVLNDGTFVSPVGPPVPPTAPIEGNFDVLTFQTFEGVCTLKQPVSLPPNIVSATLSWKDRVRNHAGEFMDDPESTHEARVSVCIDGGLGTPIEVWSTNPGDASQQIGPNAHSFDVTSILQASTTSTVDIRLDEEVKLWYFNMNWDAVSLRVCSVQAS